MKMKKIDRAYFSHARVGLFTHYTYPTYANPAKAARGGTVRSQTDMSTAVSAEEAAALFDGEKYAAVAHAMGAEYVVFTAAHAGFNLLFPSKTMQDAGCAHKCAGKSDAIGKLLDALRPYGIPLVLYMPPNDDHDIEEADLKKMGWYQDPAGRSAFLIRLIGEIHERYGTEIAGYWFDQGGPEVCVCDFVRVCNPDAVIFVNTGVTANTQKHPNSDFIVSEYYGSIESVDSDTLPVHYSQVNRQIGNWWAMGGHAPTDARSLYRYTVRTIAVEGQCNAGIAWSCGPYLDQNWEDGVEALLRQLGGLLCAHEGIYGTVPGRSYVEAPNAVLDMSQWGVSTESPDGKTVYLHVLNRPADGVLMLECPADGKIFREAWYQDEKLTLNAAPNGYAICLPAENDGVDTVIRLVV